jgi:hypothetical protein
MEKEKTSFLFSLFYLLFPLEIDPAKFTHFRRNHREKLKSVQVILTLQPIKTEQTRCAFTG